MKVNIGKGIEMDVDVSALNADVMAHVQYIGLRNILMDSHANVTKESVGDGDVTEQSRAVAEKKLAALMAGEIRVAGTRESDPVKAEMNRLATNAVHAQIKKSGRQLKSVDAKAIRAKAVEIAERFRAQAEKNIAEQKSVDIGDLDI